jgi:hypothetical protein
VLLEDWRSMTAVEMMAAAEAVPVEVVALPYEWCD